MTDLQGMGTTESLFKLYVHQYVRTDLWNITFNLVIVFMIFLSNWDKNNSCFFSIKNSSLFVTAVTLPR